MLREVPSDLTGEFGEALDRLVKRKKRVFPDDRRVIGDYTYTCDQDGGHLQVMFGMDSKDLPV